MCIHTSIKEMQLQTEQQSEHAPSTQLHWVACFRGLAGWPCPHPTPRMFLGLPRMNHCSLICPKKQLGEVNDFVHLVMATILDTV